jgi:outer membrane murein-binding lipoprotein Lpp
MRFVAMLGLAVLAGCVSGPSAYDQQSARVDRAYAAWHAVADQYEALLDRCEAARDPCTGRFDQLDRELAAADRIIAFEERRLDEARVAANTAASRRAAAGAAMMSFGASVLQQTQPPIVCRTSDTSIPTTVCQ